MLKEPWIITSHINNAWILDFDFLVFEKVKNPRASCLEMGVICVFFVICFDLPWLVDFCFVLIIFNHEKKIVWL